MVREFVEVHFRKRRALTADPKICSGCQTCEIICSLIHERTIDRDRSRIYVKANPFKGSFIPIFCHQCSDAPCYYACSESAIEIEKSNGSIVINQKKCTGCRSCEEACPFNVIRFDKVRNIVFKCDLCHGDPECVKWCPVNALGIIQFGEDVTR